MEILEEFEEVGTLNAMLESVLSILFCYLISYKVCLYLM